MFHLNKGVLRRKRRAFTLIEFVVVIGLAGLIFTTGVVPLLFTVRSISNIQKDFTEKSRERAVFNMIVRDIRHSVSENVSSPIKILESEQFAMIPRKAIAIWSETAAVFGEPLCNAIYAIPKDYVAGDQKIGLRRWVVSRDVTQDNIETIMKEEPSEHVLSGVTGLRIECLEGAEWLENYSGSIPSAIRIFFIYNRHEKRYETWFPTVDM